MAAIKKSNPRFLLKLLPYYKESHSESRLRASRGWVSGESLMSELERNLNRILQEHQLESGLHMIGGQRRLVDRLVEFLKEPKDAGDRAPADRKNEN
jgi:hypothetical protein